MKVETLEENGKINGTVIQALAMYRWQNSFESLSSKWPLGEPRSGGKIQKGEHHWWKSGHRYERSNWGEKEWRRFIIKNNNVQWQQWNVPLWCYKMVAQPCLRRWYMNVQNTCSQPTHCVWPTDMFVWPTHLVCNSLSPCMIRNSYLIL